MSSAYHLLEKLIDKNYYLNKSAKEAYRSWMQSYAQQALKDVFNVHSLDVMAVAKSFGFSVPPRVHLKIGLKAKPQKKPASDEGESGEPSYTLPGGGNRQWCR